MRKISLFLFCIILLILCIGTVNADGGDVSIFPLTRYNYKNIDGYGFYDKCADFSWFGMILQNSSSQSVTVTFPDEVHVTGWNGTLHPLQNLRYRTIDPAKKNFLSVPREGTAFRKTMILPANSTYAVFMDITEFSRYNLYWDTNVFFTIRISDGNETADRDVKGVVAQRGNACAASQVCSAEVISGSYTSGGTGEVILTVRNDMPDTANVTAQSRISVTWTDAQGSRQARTLSKGVTWNKQPGWMSSGSQQTISGTLSLPIDITTAAEELDITFHFYHPSSLFFGNFETTARLRLVSGLQGSLTGTYEADGSGGSFSAVLNNHQNRSASVILPSEGTVTTSKGSYAKVELIWSQNNPVSIGAESKAFLTGTFKFSDPSLIHSNSTLILSAEISDELSSGTAAGTVTRNPDKDPTLSSVGFCRNFTQGDTLVTFVYVIRNNSHIDIPVQLAGTLAVDGQPRNLPIRYTGCESSGSSCFSRINGTSFVIEAGETAAFTGEVTLELPPSKADFSVRTSLLYTPDGETKALYVGQTVAACSAETADPVPTAIETQQTAAAETQIPTAVWNPTATALPTELPVITQQPAATHISSATPSQVPAATATIVPTAAATAVPSATPTDIPQPIIQPQEPELNISVTGANYTSCGSDPSLHFTVMLHNSGNAAGAVNPENIRFSMDGETIPVKFSSCVQMSAAGSSNDSCLDTLNAGDFSLLPDVTLRLEGVYTPLSTIDAESVLISVHAAGMNPSDFDFEAISVSASCKPIIETIPGPDGKDIRSYISAEGNLVTLSVQLVNSGNTSAVIIPGTVYLHNAALDSYEGTGIINPIAVETAGKDSFIFSKGNAFELPAQSTAELSLDLAADPQSITVRSAAINWNFSISNERMNLTGTVLFPQRTSVSPRPTTGSNNAIEFFSVGDPEIPEILPATGFSASSPVTRASVQPADLAYTTLNGLHLEIPVIGASMDILRIPLDENHEWAVEWLKDEAGILTDAPLPGEGTSLIAAHNHLDTMNTGPFFMLYQLETGDRIFVTDADGTFLMYSVYENMLVTPLQSDSIFRNAIPGSLVLMTCESELPEGGYAYRRVVFAEPLQ